MQKNVFFAATAAALIAGATMAAPAQAASTCGEMAKAKASNMMERVQMRRECKKSMRTEKRDGMFSRLNFMKDRS
ncbi:MAG: hypothetical protein QNJ62_11040 [Methyloceanibacter sp.]|nr:hypothetical protein [Methyloceanibacter sp.]